MKEVGITKNAIRIGSIVLALVAVGNDKALARDLRNAVGGGVLSVSRTEALPDLDIRYIERDPRYDFDQNLGYGRSYWYNKARGWPEAGSDVRYTAYIKNAGLVASGNFSYCWKIDGQVVSTGQCDSLQPSPTDSLIETQVSLYWKWDSNPHTIEFIVDPDRQLKELCKSNNSLTEQTNALSVGFWIERTRYQYYNQKQYQHCAQYNIESNSWEDWAQRQVREWNRMLSESGVIDRVRLDKIALVEDNALPLAGGGYDTNFPDLSDRTVDMEWGFPTVDWAGGGFDKLEDHAGRPFWEDPHIVETSLLHELSHARTLEDLYGINVVLSDNVHLVNPPYLFAQPMWYDHLYYNIGYGIMAGGRGSLPPYDDYLKGAWNSIGGLRALYGNCNGTSRPTYPADLPANMDLKILDREDNPLRNATVKIYKYDWIPGCYGKQFHSAPDLVVQSSAEGIVDLGPDPFGVGIFEDFSVRDKLLFLVEVNYADQKSYRFCQASEFITAYWNGNTESYACPIKTNIQTSYSGFSITTPVNGAEVNNRVPVAVATGTSCPKLNEARFYINDVLTYTTTTQPFMWGSSDHGNGFETNNYPDGTYTLQVKGVDANGQALVSDTVTITVRNDPPRIVYVSSINNTIYWGTDRPGTSQVEYGLTTAYGNSTPLDSNLTNAHAVSLPSLVPDNTYHYRVRSKDDMGRESISGDSTLIYATLPPDIEVSNIKFYRPYQPETPENEITVPVVGELVICKATLKNIGGSSTGIFNVKCYVDGTQKGYGSHKSLAAGELSNDNVRFEWMPAQGNHYLKFAADVDNQVAEVDESNNSYALTVQMRPDIAVTNIKFYKPGLPEIPANEITTPVAGQRVICKATVQNVGGANTGIFRVKWYLDNVQVEHGNHKSLLPGEVSNDNVKFSWKPTQGVHTLKFSADVDNRVTELNEDNNTYSFAGKILP